MTETETKKNETYRNEAEVEIKDGRSLSLECSQTQMTIENDV